MNGRTVDASDSQPRTFSDNYRRLVSSNSVAVTFHGNAIISNFLPRHFQTCSPGGANLEPVARAQLTFARIASNPLERPTGMARFTSPYILILAPLTAPEMKHLISPGCEIWEDYHIPIAGFPTLLCLAREGGRERQGWKFSRRYRN